MPIKFQLLHKLVWTCINGTKPSVSTLFFFLQWCDCIYAHTITIGGTKVYESKETVELKNILNQNTV